MSAPQTTLDVLRAARALIAEPERWTRHEYARTKTGRACQPRSPRAVAFCVMGALARASDFDRAFRIEDDVLRPITGYVELHFFNDDHTHPDILALLDEAITLTESEAGR